MPQQLCMKWVLPPGVTLPPLFYHKELIRVNKNHFSSHGLCLHRLLATFYQDTSKQKTTQTILLESFCCSKSQATEKSQG